jgi:TorA maturation chaperone TorD
VTRFNPAGGEAARAALYLALAEALAEPPPWLAEAGERWPLLEHARRLAHNSPAAAQASTSLAAIRAEPISRRRQRYARLFAGPSNPRLWPYESWQRGGRLLGQEVAAVEVLYRAAGLQPATTEPPDHASTELAFLAHLAKQGAADNERRRQWRVVERRFIRHHAGCWLPALGQALAEHGDPVYGPIGRLLAGWLTEAARPERASPPRGETSRPCMVAADTCILCGFCVGVCQPRAIRVEENENITRLFFLAATCTGCRRCESVCPSQALVASEATGPAGWLLWRESPRLPCPSCGRPTVSQAELEFVRQQIGQAGWLEYCLACRQ